jgi:hypothetical protein
MSATLTLEELPALVAKLQDSAGRDKALTDAFLEVGTALADILALLEKQGPETANAISSALKELKITMPEAKAQQVNVTVPEITVPAPQVTVNVPAQEHRKLSLKIVPKRGVNGMAESYTITEA